MAVALDASSESHTGTTGSTNQASFTWNHTPVGTPKGVLVFVVTFVNAGDVSSVTYGGVAMTAVPGGRAVDTAGEPCRCDAYFLGSGVPTGTQAVVVNRANNADVMYAVAYTVTALTNTVVHPGSVVLVQEDGTVAEQSVTDGSPGTNSLRFACGTFGHTTPPVAGANSSAGPLIDIGAQCAVSVSETAAGQGSRSVGMSSGTSDDRAIVHLAVREVVNTTVTPGVLSVVTSAFAPTVSVHDNKVATPGTKALATGAFAPTVLAPRACTPGTKSLALSGFAPTASVPRLCVPGAAAVSLAAFAPSVDASTGAGAGQGCSFGSGIGVGL